MRLGWSQRIRLARSPIRLLSGKMRAVEEQLLVNADAFARCAEEVRRHDPDRYLAALFASGAERQGLFALYAFNLEVARVRERVDEPMMGEIRLQWWHDALDRIFAGRPLRHDVSEALAHTIESASLPRAPFDEIIEARRLDLSEARMAGKADLEAYARATASGLVRLAAQVLVGGSLSPALLEAADAAGRAWAYTGILRAVPIHAARRQFFLPLDAFVAAGGDVESVFAQKPSPALAQSIKKLAGMAKAARAEARLAFARAGETKALPAFLMLALVPSLLARIDREGFDPFRDGEALSRLFRLSRILRAGLFGRF